MRKLAVGLIISGLRPETLGSADGKDGLKSSDFPEMKIENGKVKFEKTPHNGKYKIHIEQGKEHLLLISKQGRIHVSEKVSRITYE